MNVLKTWKQKINSILNKRDTQINQNFGQSIESLANYRIQNSFDSLSSELNDNVNNLNSITSSQLNNSISNLSFNINNSISNTSNYIQNNYVKLNKDYSSSAIWNHTSNIDLNNPFPQDSIDSPAILFRTKNNEVLVDILPKLKHRGFLPSTPLLRFRSLTRLLQQVMPHLHVI